MVSAGLRSELADCSFLGNNYEVISEIFPIGETDLNYVVSGMNGFEVRRRFTVNTSVQICEVSAVEVIEFILVPDFWRGQETFEFMFCNNILIDIYWHN